MSSLVWPQIRLVWSSFTGTQQLSHSLSLPSGSLCAQSMLLWFADSCQPPTHCGPPLLQQNGTQILCAQLSGRGVVVHPSGKVSIILCPR